MQRHITLTKKQATQKKQNDESKQKCLKSKYVLKNSFKILID